MKNNIHGWINLNKPAGITSAAAVNQVKYLLKPEKIGHAGTLDPLATGVLPLALGEGTKCVNLLMDAKKTYEFTVTFGESRDTDDSAGAVVETSEVIPTETQLREILPRFIGQISQMPPDYSALKVDGKRAYKLARAGKEVTLKVRPVTIHSLELIDFKDKTASFRALVGKGTYIRSLGRDIAAACGALGYISRLHRAQVGPFTDSTAISLDFLEKSVHNAPPTGANPEWMLPLSVALDDIPALSLTAVQFATLYHGHSVEWPTQKDSAIAAALYKGQVVALAKVEAGKLIPARRLNIFEPDVAKETL
jgi:tRNA pseudouridine55 synthase